MNITYKEYMEMIDQIVSLRCQNQHLKKLLSESKKCMRLATIHNKENACYFSRIIPILTANDVKSFFELNCDL